MDNAGLPTHLKRAYIRFAEIANVFQSVFLLIIRLYIGYECMMAGYGHLKNFSDTAEFFASLHIPMPKVNVAIAGTTEMVGGALLMAGFASRLISIPLVFNFIVAICAVKLNNPKLRDDFLHFWKSDNDVIIFRDTAFPFLMTALIVLIFGPGWFSVDGIIRKLMMKKTPKQVFPTK